MGCPACQLCLLLHTPISPQLQLSGRRKLSGWESVPLSEEERNSGQSLLKPEINLLTTTNVSAGLTNRTAMLSAQSAQKEAPDAQHPSEQLEGPFSRVCAGCHQSPCSPVPAKVPEPCNSQPPQGRPNAKQNKQEPQSAIRALRFCRCHRAQLSCWGGSPVLGSGHRGAKNKQTVRVNGAAVIFGLEGVHTVRVVVVNNCERSRRRGERDGTDRASPPRCQQEAAPRGHRRCHLLLQHPQRRDAGGRGRCRSRQRGHRGRTWRRMDAPHCSCTQHGSVLAAPLHPQCHRSSARRPADTALQRCGTAVRMQPQEPTCAEMNTFFTFPFFWKE